MNECEYRLQHLTARERACGKPVVYELEIAVDDAEPVGEAGG